MHNLGGIIVLFSVRTRFSIPYTIPIYCKCTVSDCNLHQTKCIQLSRVGCVSVLTLHAIPPHVGTETGTFRKKMLINGKKGWKLEF